MKYDHMMHVLAAFKSVQPDSPDPLTDPTGCMTHLLLGLRNFTHERMMAAAPFAPGVPSFGRAVVDSQQLFDQQNGGLLPRPSIPANYVERQELRDNSQP